jgi:hypothetical protein
MFRIALAPDGNLSDMVIVCERLVWVSSRHHTAEISTGWSAK